MWIQSGELVFLGGGKIMGCLDFIVDVEFSGTLSLKTNSPARGVEDIAKEWGGYNEKAHAREAHGRWGGCCDSSSSSDGEDEEKELEKMMESTAFRQALDKQNAQSLPF